MSTAEVISIEDYRNNEVAKVADLDNGYTRIANELYDALIGADLTKHQQKVAHAVVRLTYGYNKKNDRIADSQIADKAKLPRCKVNTAKNELLDMNVLILDGKKIGINKNISAWNISKSYQNSNTIQNGNKVTENVTKSVTETVIGLLPKTEHTKDIISKDKKDIKEKINKKEISPKSVKTPFPENLAINESNQKLANEFGLNVEFEFGKFRDRNLAIGGKYINWHSAFSGWLRKAYEFKQVGKKQSATAQPKQPSMTPERQREYDQYLFMNGLT